MNFSSFAISTDSDLPSRLILLVTLLLTMVAFSLVLDDKIPNVRYVTFLEKYIFVNYAFLAYLLAQSIFSTYTKIDIYGISNNFFIVYGTVYYKGSTFLTVCMQII